MPRETELTAEAWEDERERRRQRVRDLREQHAQRRAEPGDGVVRKSMGDALPRAEVPEGFTLFGDARDQQLVGVLGMVISITRRQLRGELAEELAERDPQLKKIAALELEVAALRGAVDVLRGKETPPPRFPAAKTWKEGAVFYAGDIITFVGSTYQAKCDTAQAPGSADWACLAAAGGSLSIRGTYGSAETYKHFDVVMINGSSFVALKDNPGRCPDTGNWHLLASRGSRGSTGLSGERGVMGLRGERGAAAPTIQSWVIDRARYTATPMMSDGSIGSSLELRGLFEQFLLETADA